MHLASFMSETRMTNHLAEASRLKKESMILTAFIYDSDSTNFIHQIQIFYFTGG
jgi:hypothetical protein